MLQRQIDLNNPLAKHPLTDGLRWWIPIGPPNAPTLKEISRRTDCTQLGGYLNSAWLSKDLLKALWLDGTSGYLQAVDATPFDLQSTFTVHLTVLIRSLAANVVLFSRTATSAWETAGRQIEVNTSGTLYWNNFAASTVDSTTTIVTNQVYRITVTHDGANAFLLYVNGAAAGGGTPTGTNVAVNAAHVVRIGQKAGGDWLPGTIFEWAYDTTQWSANKIAQWYEQSVRGHPDTLNYYKPKSYLFLNTAGATHYTLTCSPGSVSITGTAASLEYGRVLACAAGSYSLTGTDATLRIARKLACDSGSVAITGTAATLRATRLLTCSGGSYSLSGTDASLEYGRKLSCDAGSYSIAGTVATLRATRRLVCDAGSYLITGTAATLRATRKLVCEAGSYLITGIDASLLYSGAASGAAYYFRRFILGRRG